jgi:glycosyltransferase involved in cell wall biosynthesis/Flp pilus assembly protein TadD
MSKVPGPAKKLALVYGNLPTVEEIDQFMLIASQYDVSVVASESVCGYLTQTSYFQDLKCLALPDHDENPTYLPGLEKALASFDVVVVKERLGMYAYQAVKAKWRRRFRLVIWVDNLTPFPGEDVAMMRTVRVEAGNAADAFIVQSEAARQVLLLEGIEEQRIHSFKPFVETRAVRNGKSRAKACEMLGLSDTDVVIGHFGQIEWEENLFELVHAMKLLQRTDPGTASRIKIVFCGIGSFSSELRDRLVALGLDRQAVYVAPHRDAFETVMTAADAMYFCNNPARDRLEGEPYRIIQAMSCGIPVIAARHPLVEEYLGKHRLDFCIGSPESLAKALKKLATAPALKSDISAKSLQAYKSRIARSKVASEMEEVFGSIARATPTVDISQLDHQVLQVETLVTSKQYLAAIDVIESIFQLKDVPRHHRSNLLRLIGDCFTKLGDGEAGKNAYMQAIELDPYSAKAFIGLGTVSLTKRNYDVAVPQFQKAVSLAPEDEMANLGLGLAFQGLGKLEEAVRWVVKSLEVNPENTVALFTLVTIASDRNRYEEAERMLDRYVALHPADQNMVYALAGIKAKQGKSGDALTLVNRILDMNPRDERALALASSIREGGVSAMTGNSSN